MKAYKEMSKEELLALKSELEAAYEDAKGKGLKLDMSRGKPSPAQLDLANGFLNAVTADESFKCENGMDTRNYGVLDGIPEAKKLMADIMGCKAEDVIICGNASLNIMYDTISRSFTHGVNGSTPWAKLDKVKFLCPAPGYDRHFRITEHFGVEMITIPMTDNGPDMDMVEKLVSADATVKGIWCVPMYSNPLGTSYSDETVKRFAALKPAAEDFRIFWDNAYCIHHLYAGEENQDSILDILSECAKAGNPDMVYEFASTSKVTYAGGGISMRPKFIAVLDVLEKELGGTGIGRWTNPKGGYFISFWSMPGCAKDIVAKCKEAGVVLTGAGATYPYGIDPEDSNIRIAPSFPSPEEMAQATDLFVLCVKLVSVEKLLAE